MAKNIAVKNNMVTSCMAGLTISGEAAETRHTQPGFPALKNESAC